MMKRLKAKQAQMQPQSSSAVNINQVMNDKKQSKLDKKQAKQQQASQSSSSPKEGELNVMGYISGSQNMNQLSSALGEDGNIYVYIGDEKKKRNKNNNEDHPKKDAGGGRHRMLRSPLKDER